MKELIKNLESVDRTLVMKNGEVKLDISWEKENCWKVGEIGDTHFQEVSTNYLEGLLKLWSVKNGKEEYKDGILTIYIK